MPHPSYAHARINGLEIEVVIGDIVQQPDMAAIVNAANAQLLPGGGVCGAVFAAAGHAELQAACRSLAPIQPGEAVLTPAFQLPNRAILHACGPRYGVDPNPGELLAACYLNLLELAERHQLESLAIPAISTGIYGFPAEEATDICINTLRQARAPMHALKRLRFVVRNADMARIYAERLASPEAQSPMSQTDRFRGCLLGLACGDAVGTTVEFRPRGSFAPVTDMVGGGPFHLKPGEWTDDTSMALCLAASLVEQGNFDSSDQMRRYVRWMDEGYMSSNGRCFDVGMATRTALNRFKHSGDPFSGSTDPRSAGNGCLMRLAPVPMFAWPNRQLAIDLSGESARTTHAAPEAIAASRLFGAILFQALAGADKETLLLGHGVQELPSEALRAIADGDYRAKPMTEIRGNGYVVQSLEAALWCFWQTDTFRDAILMASNLGDDADTTAAICGQVAGTYYGEPGIPPRWIEQLVMAREIRDLADRLEALTP